MGRISFVDGAPPVRLDVCIVSNRGVRVTSAPDDPNLGRVVVATRDLTLDSVPLYTPLLRERPALVCERGGYLEYVEGFLDADEEIQLGILDMFYQPLDGPMGRSVEGPAILLYQLGVLDDVTVLHQLLCILVTNGCQYQETQAALAIFGSKFSHSCDPNAAYSSTASDGCLEYLLLKGDVRNGDEVTFSYLSDVLETETPERRRLLWQTKAFVCECPRCVGPDYTRCLPCPSCRRPVPCRYHHVRRDGEGPIATRRRAEDNDDAWDAWDVLWECDGCGETADMYVMLHQERELGRTLKAVARRIESRKTYEEMEEGDNDDGGGWDNPAFVREVVDECRSTLSPTHHLTVKALRLLVTASTARAYARMTNQVAAGVGCVGVGGRTRRRAASSSSSSVKTWSFLRMSVVAGMQLVLACECVAAGCPGCYLDLSAGYDAEAGGGEQPRPSSCSDDDDSNHASTAAAALRICHPPHYDRATPMRHVCENLLQMPIHMWPSDGLTMVVRYVPILRAKFKGILEDERGRIGDVLANLRCVECDSSGGLVWDGNIESLSEP